MTLQHRLDVPFFRYDEYEANFRNKKKPITFCTKRDHSSIKHMSRIRALNHIKCITESQFLEIKITGWNIYKCIRVSPFSNKTT